MNQVNFPPSTNPKDIAVTSFVKMKADGDMEFEWGSIPASDTGGDDYFFLDMWERRHGRPWQSDLKCYVAKYLL